MHPEPDVKPPPRWLGPLLCALLVFLYSSTFLVDYLMNDEMRFVGARLPLWPTVARRFLGEGRALFGATTSLLYGALGYSAGRIQWARFVNVLSHALSAWVVLRCLVRAEGGRWLPAALVVILLYSQRCTQGVIGYGLVSLTLLEPALWLGLAAYGLHFRLFRGRRPIVEHGAVLLLITAALQLHQTLAYFALVPVGWLVLTDWPAQRRRVWSFLGLTALALALSTVALHVGLAWLHAHGDTGYDRAEAALGTLRSSPGRFVLGWLNPTRYWSAFQLWSYPFPLDHLHTSRPLRRGLALAVMAAWATLVGWAARREWARTPSGERSWGRALALLGCLAFAAMSLVADGASDSTGGDLRPHIGAPLNGLVIVIGWYALRVLCADWSDRRRRLGTLVAGVVVGLSALGAQGAVLTGMVLPRATELAFVRQELSVRPPATWRRVVVLLPSESPTCVAPPCVDWIGWHITVGWHAEQDGRYRFALAQLGIDPESKRVEVVEDHLPADLSDAVVVDWPRFARSAARR